MKCLFLKNRVDTGCLEPFYSFLLFPEPFRLLEVLEACVFRVGCEDMGMRVRK